MSQYKQMRSTMAFIFDLDGVIVDTAKYHYLAWHQLADRLGIPFNKADNERLKGVSRVQSLELLLSLGGRRISAAEKQQYLEEKNRQYLSFVHKMTTDEILPGVPALLDFLDANHIRYALGSASKNAALILQKVGLYERFSAIVDGNEVAQAKPAPEVFLLGAQKLKVQAQDCVVVEDAIAGVEAARAAGMKCIGIGDKEVLGKADIVFKEMADIDINYIKNLINND
ncbi:MAG: beta-phosphoglucomutase [Lutibacter sp.]|nr:beta-phosphoglucomutase [Lutibacter sp.]